MSASQNQVPIVLLKEGTSETKGNQAQRNNITAAKTILKEIDVHHPAAKMKACQSRAEPMVEWATWTCDIMSSSSLLFRQSYVKIRGATRSGF